MKKFLLRIILLSILTSIFLTLSLFFIKDKVAQTSILGALTDKHVLLKKIPSPKIILVGGSNVSFGIDSKSIKNALQKPVVNMGVHAGLGLQYIINDVKPYIKSGDTVILMPEYEHFYTDNFYGEIELVSAVFDIEPNSKSLLTNTQWKHVLKYLPTYAAKKIKNSYSSFISHKPENIDVYHRKSFNNFGDAYLHWNLPNQTYAPALVNNGSENVNTEVVTFLNKFKTFLKSKHATLIMLPPVIDSASFQHQQSIINTISKQLTLNNLGFITAPSSYQYSSSLFFNSYYHLNKQGVDKRSKQLIIDFKKIR